jgi:DNA polymerase III subunit gamma/tau
MPAPAHAQALYRRWRPQTFEDVIGQAHITHTLRNAVNGGRLAHAYLFTGPRGTGKTSVARILAKAVNCTGEGARPCNACGICLSMTEGRALDLIEIDAASNTGVDDVRDLREKIAFSPNETTYKVYIIDEVHMLSTAAFNALLKTLEEPPPHALFILATTEPHKIPDTILSRCQRYDFRRVPVAQLVEKLARICAAEGTEADPAALDLVARSATGSIRDAESLLDQLMALGERLTVDLVRDVLGTPTDAAVVEVAGALVARDAGRGLAVIHAALDRGADVRQLQAQVLDYLRGLLLIQSGVDPALLDATSDQLEVMRAQATGLPPADLIAAMHLFNDARPSADHTHPSLPLELALVEAVLGKPDPPARVDLPVAEVAPVRPAPGPRHAMAPVQHPSTRTAQAPATRTGPPPTGTGAGPGATAQRPAVDVPVARAAAEDAPPVGAPADSAPSGMDAPAVGVPSGVDAPPADPSPVAARSPAAALAQVQERWAAVLAAVGRRDKNTAALLKDCRPVAADATSVSLGFFYEFHCARVAEPKRAALVADALAEVLGAPRAVVCTVVPASAADADTRPRTKADQARQDPVIRHAVESLGARVAGVKSEDG